MSQVDKLDEVKLASYLEANIDDFKGPLSAIEFPGGHSNPTFKIEAQSASYVLRRQPPGELLKSAHAVDREYRILKALANTEVPVAKVYYLCEDKEVIGSMFYIMEFCDGNIHWDAALKDITSKEQRGKMYDEMNRVLAAIHSVDIEKAQLTDYGKPGNYFYRQFDRWSTQYKNSDLKPIPEMDELIDWLSDNLPDDDGKTSITHGDYRLDNVMFSKDDNKIIAVLDWELSTLGHPYADLAYQCMGMRLPSTDSSFTMSDLRGFDRQASGIPTEQEYVASYCERMGIEKIDNWNFYLCFSFFRLAAISHGIAKRAADGNASNKAASSMGALVQPLAKLALEIIN